MVGRSAQEGEPSVLEFIPIIEKKIIKRNNDSVTEYTGRILNSRGFRICSESLQHVEDKIYQKIKELKGEAYV